MPSEHGRGRYQPRPAGDNPEWYTPAHIIEFCREVLGGIALDPASNAEADKIVKAGRYFTAADDGLAQSWIVEGDGGVFCNPPYGRRRGSLTAVWWRKMKDEFDAGHFDTGLFLANATTETAWFQDALATCPVLLLRGRLSFWRPGGPSHNGFFGSALVLLSRPIKSGSPVPLRDPPPAPASLATTSLATTSLTSWPVSLARFLAPGRGLGVVVAAVQMSDG